MQPKFVLMLGPRDWCACSWQFLTKQRNIFAKRSVFPHLVLAAGGLGEDAGLAPRGQNRRGDRMGSARRQSRDGHVGVLHRRPPQTVRHPSQWPQRCGPQPALPVDPFRWAQLEVSCLHYIVCHRSPRYAFPRPVHCRVTIGSKLKKKKNSIDRYWINLMENLHWMEVLRGTKWLCVLNSAANLQNFVWVPVFHPANVCAIEGRSRLLPRSAAATGSQLCQWIVWWVQHRSNCFSPPSRGAAGHISAQRVALQTQQSGRKTGVSVASFIEELVVRRELTDNFCFYNENYDSVKGQFRVGSRTLITLSHWCYKHAAGFLTSQVLTSGRRRP